MKPNEGTFAANAERYGVAGLNVDGCRIATDVRPNRAVHPLRDGVEYHGTSLCGRADDSLQSSKAVGTTTQGRWPANVVLDEAAGAMLDEQAGERGDHGTTMRGQKPTRHSGSGCFAGGAKSNLNVYADSGGPSRFFYCSKASRSERTAGGKVENTHPTVKPLKLMEWLCRLVCPPENGIVLDPFMGSGTTALAALATGQRFVGIEQDPASFDTAVARIKAWHEQNAGDMPLLTGT